MPETETNKENTDEWEKLLTPKDAPRVPKILRLHDMPCFYHIACYDKMPRHLAKHISLVCTMYGLDKESTLASVKQKSMLILGREYDTSDIETYTEATIQNFINEYKGDYPEKEITCHSMQCTRTARKVKLRENACIYCPLSENYANAREGLEKAFVRYMISRPDDAEWRIVFDRNWFTYTEILGPSLDHTKYPVLLPYKNLAIYIYDHPDELSVPEMGKNILDHKKELLTAFYYGSLEEAFTKTRTSFNPEMQLQTAREFIAALCKEPVKPFDDILTDLPRLFDQKNYIPYVINNQKQKEYLEKFREEGVLNKTSGKSNIIKYMSSEHTESPEGMTYAETPCGDQEDPRKPSEKDAATNIDTQNLPSGFGTNDTTECKTNNKFPETIEKNTETIESAISPEDIVRYETTSHESVCPDYEPDADGTDELLETDPCCYDDIDFDMPESFKEESDNSGYGEYTGNAVTPTNDQKEPEPNTCSAEAVPNTICTTLPTEEQEVTTVSLTTALSCPSHADPFSETNAEHTAESIAETGTEASEMASKINAGTLQGPTETETKDTVATLSPGKGLLSGKSVIKKPLLCGRTVINDYMDLSAETIVPGSVLAEQVAEIMDFGFISREEYETEIHTGIPDVDEEAESNPFSDICGITEVPYISNYFKGIIIEADAGAIYMTSLLEDAENTEHIAVEYVRKGFVYGFLLFVRNKFYFVNPARGHVKLINALFDRKGGTFISINPVRVHAALLSVGIPYQSITSLAVKYSVSRNMDTLPDIKRMFSDCVYGGTISEDRDTLLQIMPKYHKLSGMLKIDKTGEAFLKFSGKYEYALSRSMDLKAFMRNYKRYVYGGNYYNAFLGFTDDDLLCSIKKDGILFDVGLNLSRFPFTENLPFWRDVAGTTAMSLKRWEHAYLIGISHQNIMYYVCSDGDLFYDKLMASVRKCAKRHRLSDGITRDAANDTPALDIKVKITVLGNRALEKARETAIRKKEEARLAISTPSEAHISPVQSEEAPEHISDGLNTNDALQGDSDASDAIDTPDTLVPAAETDCGTFCRTDSDTESGTKTPAPDTGNGKSAVNINPDGASTPAPGDADSYTRNEVLPDGTGNVTDPAVFGIRKDEKTNRKDKPEKKPLFDDTYKK